MCSSQAFQALCGKLRFENAAQVGENKWVSRVTTAEFRTRA